jgi:hypothetical protein
MSKKFEQIIYKEATQPDEAYVYDESDDVFFAEELQGEPEGLVGAIMGLEDEDSLGSDLADKTIKEVLEPMAEGEESFGGLAEELKNLDSEVTELVKDHGDVVLGDLLPGADVRPEELEDDVEEKETDYENDGDLSKFMAYITDQYPSKIPQHDGRTTLGCERALSFLGRTNDEISRAIKGDRDSLLDIAALEDIRVAIMRDVLVLKDHLNKLNKKVKEDHSKRASAKLPPAWAASSGESVDYKDLVKEAGTPSNIVITVTAFERAISGIMINAHVSAGHPMEEVYDFLAKKYDLTDREELSIMQILVDSGFHVFKDRGSFSQKINKDDSTGKQNVDFMRNYFA